MNIRGDARAIPLASESVQSVVTSPPFWGLRDYGTARWVGGASDCAHQGTDRYYTERTAAVSSAEAFSLAGVANAERIKQGRWREAGDCRCGARRVDAQIGLEATPDSYVATLVEVFREVWRVLKPTGTLWLNLGDSYVGSVMGVGAKSVTAKQGSNAGSDAFRRNGSLPPSHKVAGLKPKDLVGIPWRVAFALQADGWYLRSDIIWSKPAPMPESVSDRPSRSHEYLFLLAKQEKYFYDANAIREPASEASLERIAQPNFANQTGGPKDYRNGVNPNRSARQTLENFALNPGRNKRSVWTINSEASPEQHYAQFPQALVSPCLLAGTSERGECSACGENWVRETVRTVGPPPDRIHNNGFKHDAMTHHGEGAATLRNVVERATTGWRAQCTCDAPARPNLVLDPFGGSGTVGMVAERYGRRWVCLDLSPPYLKIAQNRTAQMGFNFGRRT
jgi:DNA modification methylase